MAEICPRCTLCLQKGFVYDPSFWCDDELVAEKANLKKFGSKRKCAACPSCFGLLQSIKTAERTISAVTNCLLKRKYDATHFKLEFMTKEFEQLERYSFQNHDDDNANDEASSSSIDIKEVQHSAAHKMPTLTQVKDIFRKTLKNAWNADEILSKLHKRTCKTHVGALLVTVNLVNASNHAKQQQRHVDMHVHKRARRQQKQHKQEKIALPVGSAKGQVQNTAFTTIPRDHQSFNIIPVLQMTTFQDMATVIQKSDVIVNVKIFREPVFVFGRYIKCSRRISQTPWIIDGVRKGISSVEEALVGPIANLFRPMTYKFHSAGREDFNVRMCGNGRPFIFELVDSTKGQLSEDQFTDLKRHMNNIKVCPTAVLVRVNSLRMAVGEFEQLKDGAETKKKSYR